MLRVAGGAEEYEFSVSRDFYRAKIQTVPSPRVAGKVQVASQPCTLDDLEEGLLKPVGTDRPEVAIRWSAETGRAIDLDDAYADGGKVPPIGIQRTHVAFTAPDGTGRFLTMRTLR